MAFWIACSMKAIKEQIDEQPKIIKLFSINYARDLVTRNKGDKDYSKSEKQLLISLINDYSLFGATDNEIIQMLSVKLNKKISETLFYRLMKEAKKIGGKSEAWFHSFALYQYTEYYRKGLEKLV